jgi:hypothetical protein
MAEDQIERLRQENPVGSLHAILSALVVSIAAFLDLATLILGQESVGLVKKTPFPG